MNAAGKTTCKVIVMTGSPQILAGFRLPKNGHAIDLMDRCVRVEPKHVLLADKAEVMEDMQQRLAAGEKVIYFANRVSTVLNLYRNAFQEYRNEAAVSFSADDELDKQEKQNREILERRDEIQAYIAENQKLPDDIRLFLTTSKNKEGINIKNADIKTMYIETHSQIDAIQMAGRVRAGLDQLYIVTDAVQNSAPESLFEYELSGRTDLQASLNAHLAQKKEDAGIAEEVYGDNVFEKHGINRDRTGDREKTRYLCGKQGIFTRDRALIRPGSIRQLETRASTRSASFFHALGGPGRPYNGGGAAGAYCTSNGAKPLKQGHLRAKRGPLGPSRKSQQHTKRTGFAAHGHSIAETAPEGKRASRANGALIRA